MAADVSEKQRLLPVVNTNGSLAGIVTRHRLEEGLGVALQEKGAMLSAFVRADAVVAFSDDPLRVVVNRMAEKGVTRMPVVERGNVKFLGMISLDDLLKARTRHLEEEQRREQSLGGCPTSVPAGRHPQSSYSDGGGSWRSGLR